MRVLIVTSNFPMTTSDTTTPMVLNLARQLVRQGVEVTVLAPHGDGAKQLEIIDGVRVHRFRYILPEQWQRLIGGGATLVNLRKRPLLWLQVPLYIVALWLSTRRMLRHGNFDVVHSQWVVPQGVVTTAAILRSKHPHLISIRGGDVFALRSRIVERLKAWALRRADAITVNSTATKAEVERLAPESVSTHIVRGGVVAYPPDKELVQSIKKRYRLEGGPVIGFVGRLVEEKGIDDLLEAVQMVMGRFPHTNLLVVGEGQDREQFRRKAETMGIGSQVHFVGWVPQEQLPSYIVCADVFVGPSRRGVDGWIEAQGLVFAEAMLYGTPVVATAVGGIPDLVRDGETGILVPEQAPADVADGIVRLLTTRDLVERITNTARQFAIDQLAMERVAESMVSIYEQIAGVAAADQS